MEEVLKMSGQPPKTNILLEKRQKYLYCKQGCHKVWKNQEKSVNTKKNNKSQEEILKSHQILSVQVYQIPYK